MTTRSLAIATSAVVAAAVIGLAYLLGAQGNHPSTTNTPTAAPPSTASPGSPTDPDADPDAGRDPVATATAWLRGYRAISWTDPAPSSWVDRIRPYIGTELAADYDRDRQGSVGAVVVGKCTSTVRDVGGVIPPEVPRAPDSVYAQVLGTVVTQCATGTPPPDEPVAATVEVRRGADGRWVVQRRLF
jgi:hypothetical protein